MGTAGEDVLLFLLVMDNGKLRHISPAEILLECVPLQLNHGAQLPLLVLSEFWPIASFLIGFS
jgi:hypothetical protein